MDFIFMLTRHDRTVEDAEDIVEEVCRLGVRHVGFKDVGVDEATMRRLVARIRDHGGACYLEVVSTTSEAIRRSLENGASLGVDCVMGGTDLDAAQRVLGRLDGYYPFPGRPVGHPTRLGGTVHDVEADSRSARARGCGGVDLLAFRATEADPLALVRAARAGLDRGRLVVAGSVHCAQQISDLATAGADAFTIGSAVFDGTFSPTKGSLRAQIRDILGACERAAEATG